MLQKIDRFINGLKKIGIEYDDMKDIFKYAGGDHGGHYNYYKLCNKTEELPEHKSECVCGQRIKKNCYISDGNILYVLGACCIKNFMKHNTRTCDICDKPHRNRIINLCNECKINYKCKSCNKYKDELKNGKCKNCNVKKCKKCGKEINEKYTHCYLCYCEYKNKQNNWSRNYLNGFRIF